MTDIVYQPAMFNMAALVYDPLDLERCESPDRAIPDLFSKTPFHIEGRILEVCSGNGMLSNQLREMGYSVTTNDYDPRVAADLHFDATDPTVEQFDGFDWCITNPPFSMALNIMKNMLPRVRIGCLFLLRLSFAEPVKARRAFFKECPPTGQIVTPRYRFYGDGNDSVTTAWFCWLNRSVPLWKGALGYQHWRQHQEFFRIVDRD